MIHKLFLLLAISFAGVSYAQYSSSPFSTQGIGEPGGLEDAQFGGIGNSRTAVIDSTTVNFYNPSSYPYLAKGQPLFAIGISSRLSRYTSDGLSSNGYVAGLNQIAMAIPVNRRIGLAFGLQPFSRRGYSITQHEGINSTDTFRYTYIGSGSTQEVFGGIGIKLLQFERHELSLGVNGGYIFGSVNNERRSELIGNDQAGAVGVESYRLHAWHYSFGMNYLAKLGFEGKQQLRLAAVYTPEQQLSAHRDYLLRSAGNVTNAQTYLDTLAIVTDDKGHITYPASTSVGFSYSFRPVTGVDYKLKSVYQINVYGDFTSTLWKSYATGFSGDNDATIYSNAHRATLGIQYTPNFNSYDRTVGRSYLNRVRYRAGGYFGTLPNSDNGVQLSEYGVTIGFGLPIASQKTNSSFNFSLQYGERGNGRPEGLQEQFVSFNFGVILAPASYDKWFKKYKLD